MEGTHKGAMDMFQHLKAAVLKTANRRTAGCDSGHGWSNQSGTAGQLGVPTISARQQQPFVPRCRLGLSPCLHHSWHHWSGPSTHIKFRCMPCGYHYHSWLHCLNTLSAPGCHQMDSGCKCVALVTYAHLVSLMQSLYGEFDELTSPSPTCARHKQPRGLVSNCTPPAIPAV